MIRLKKSITFVLGAFLFSSAQTFARELIGTPEQRTSYANRSISHLAQLFGYQLTTVDSIDALDTSINTTPRISWMHDQNEASAYAGYKALFRLAKNGVCYKGKISLVELDHDLRASIIVSSIKRIQDEHKTAAWNTYQTAQRFDSTQGGIYMFLFKHANIDELFIKPASFSSATFAQDLRLETTNCK